MATNKNITHYFDTQDWQKAIDLFKQIDKEHPGKNQLVVIPENCDTEGYWVEPLGTNIAFEPKAYVYRTLEEVLALEIKLKS